jgi:seryl-tRNA synthetase
MKDKKYKYLGDLIEEYIDLTNEQKEIPQLIDKARSKYDEFTKENNGTVIDAADAQEVFKSFSQLKKYDERKKEIEEELNDVETQLKEFLHFFTGRKVSYEKKDDNKIRTTFLFSLQDGTLHCER